MNDQLETRLRALEQPENQGDPLDRKGFTKLAALTLVLPIVLLFVGWVFM